MGGDPRALMEHMLKNPGIMPGSLEEIQDSRDNMRFVDYYFGIITIIIVVFFFLFFFFFE